MWSCSKCNFIMGNSDLCCNNCGSTRLEGSDYIYLERIKPYKKSYLRSIFSYWLLWILLLYILFGMANGITLGIIAFLAMKFWFFDKGIGRSL